ncbi:MAG TPA: hypothetical protein VIY73_26100, partial [Polyangiaceae bacterium]
MDGAGVLEAAGVLEGPGCGAAGVEAGGCRLEAGDGSAVTAEGASSEGGEREAASPLEPRCFKATRPAPPRPRRTTAAPMPMAIA